MTLVEQTYQSLPEEKREHTAMGFDRSTGLYSFFYKHPDDKLTFKQLLRLVRRGKSYMRVMEAHEMIDFLKSL